MAEWSVYGLTLLIWFDKIGWTLNIAPILKFMQLCFHCFRLLKISGFRVYSSKLNKKLTFNFIISFPKRIYFSKDQARKKELFSLPHFFPGDFCFTCGELSFLSKNMFECLPFELHINISRSQLKIMSSGYFDWN